MESSNCIRTPGINPRLHDLLTLLGRATPFLLAAVAFIIPISSTGKSIALGLAMASILLNPQDWSTILDAFRKPWGIACIVLFGLALAACFWSTAPFSQRMLVLEKYSKLLYLPVLVAGFRDSRTRTASILAFLGAMVITGLLSIYLNAYPHLPKKFHADFVFRNHIMTGMMMSFGAFVAGWYAFQLKGWRKIPCIAAIAVFAWQTFFISTGRMAYANFMLLMLLLVFTTMPWRKVFLPAVMVCMLVALGYHQSPLMQRQIDKAVREVTHFEQNRNTSVGFRIQFHQYALKLFTEHPVAGNGTGAFTARFDRENPVPAWNRHLLEPHSQYWLVASEFGILGLAALAFLFGSLLYSAMKLERYRPLGLAMLLPFFMGNLTDSLLLYSGSGYFFIFFMALCLSENSTRQPLKE